MATYGPQAAILTIMPSESDGADRFRPVSWIIADFNSTDFNSAGFK
jgi:hypothetical protein